MTQINDYTAGVASLQTEAFDTQELITGDTPITTLPMTVATATVSVAALPANSVVGYDVSGNLVKAVYDGAVPANNIYAIGITVSDVPMGLTLPSVSVRRSGCFNPNLLVWGASYTTDAIKKRAFETAAQMIFVRKPQYT
jgi:hypothetical protein